MTSKSELKMGNSKRSFWGSKRCIRIAAMCLATIIVLSVFSENISSIVDLLTAYAADESIYYSADLTLYDYYTDNEIINGGSDDNIRDTLNRNKVFNTALYDSGYSGKAADETHTWDGQNLKYFPLYLGLQFPGDNINNFMLNAEGNKYNYSMTANSEANSTTSGAALGLVDDTLHNGVLTQGDCTVALPYFDEEFLTAPIGNILSEESIEDLGLSSVTSKTLGRVEEGYNFKFIKDNTTGYYVYDSANYGLDYSNKTFTANPSGGKKYIDLMDGYGFFPWCYIDSSSKNFGYAAKFSIPFTMSTDGTIVNMDDSGNATSGTSPIEFNFRGDDDVWVFIDDKLVLDIGGAHGAVEGYINFKEKTAKTKYVKTSTMYNQNGVATVGAGSEVDLTQIFEELGLYDDVTKQHTLTVYYVERGSMESNCYISFNFQIADSISVENQLDTSDVNPYFAYETWVAATQEGIEYVIASNSSTSTMDSPDVGKQNEDLPNAEKWCTFNFDSGGDYGSYPSYSVYVGTETMLPNGYKLYRPGYHIKGWSLNPDGSGTAYTSYKATTEGSITFYAVWEEIPYNVNLEAASSPTIMILDVGGETDWDKSSGLKLSDISAPNVGDLTGSSYQYYPFAYMSHDSSNHSYIAILTYASDLNKNTYIVNENWDNTPYKQYPNYDSGDGKDRFNVTSGAINHIYVHGAYSNRYDRTIALNSFTASSISNIGAADSGFVINYIALYNALNSAKNVIESSTASKEELMAMESNYNVALEYYKKINYTSTTKATLNGNASTVGSVLYYINQLSDIANASIETASLYSTDAASVDDTETTSEQITIISDDITNDDATLDDESMSASNQDETSVQNEMTVKDSDDVEALAEDGETSAVSGATQEDGQFINDGTKYAYAKSTNFKLYDSYFTDVTGGERDFIVRQTSKENKGEFNLQFKQKATFTYQFKRFSGIKIAQTGTSYKFDMTDDELHSGNTVLADSSTEKYSDANSDNALYNRYSTTWVVKDEEGGTIVSSRENYSVYPVAGDTITGDNEATIRSKSTNSSLYIDNIKEAANANTGIHLTATFTNKVLVGDLTITKTLTQDALTAIQDYRKEHPDYDPEFAFQVYFKNVFGGGSSGMVYQNVSAGVGQYYINGTTASSAYKTVNGLNGCIVMKYSDLYDDDGNAKAYSIVIKGIPVETEFTIREVIVNDENTPNLQLQSVTQAVLSDKTTLTPDENNAVSGVITSQKDTNNGVDVSTNLQTGPLASYYPVLTDSTDLTAQFVNDIENAYIILTKTIDELYYGANDNPAGLLGTGGTVGGATATTDDPNGYEAATEAEQTFMFKISEYSSATASTASKTFYEVISFPKGSGLSNSKLIKVDPTKYYKVEEVSDWSWKYTFIGVSVTKNGTNGNSVSNKVATVHNFGETAEFNGVTYSRTDTVTFTNNKKTDNTEDVEGDTSIMINIIGKAS